MRFLTIFLTIAAFHVGHASDMRESLGALERYEPLYDALDDLPRSRQLEFKTNARKALGGDGTVGFYPRVMPASEYNRIAAAVAQRAKAISLFLRDYFSANHRYDKVIPEEILKAIVERSGEAGYRGLVSPDQIAFFYGPDLMQSHFLEDNLNAVGYFGDLMSDYDITMENLPEILDHVRPRNPKEFYGSMVADFRARSNGNKVVFLNSGGEVDKETYRLGRLFAEYGIETIYATSKLKGLSVTDNGVYAVDKRTGRRTKVGFVILSGDHNWFDNSTPAAWERLVMEMASEILRGRTRKSVRARLMELLARPPSAERLNKLAAVIREVDPWSLEKAPFPGLISAILKGQVATNNTPGIEFVGDKQFYMYVPDLIRFYLKEEPKIENVPTRVFVDKTGRVDRRLIEKVFANIQKYVIKAFDGRGGDSVWVGAKIKKDKIAEVRAKVESNPGEYEVQKYLPPTGDYIYDLRVLSYAHMENGTVTIDQANTGISRVAKSSGDGRVNESAGQGTPAVVLVEKSRAQCASLVTGQSSE